MTETIRAEPDAGGRMPRYDLVLLLLILFAAALRLVFFSGVSSADDLSVANAALRLLDQGPYLPDSHYSARLVLVYPLAAIFALFGTGEWQMALLPMLASLGTMVVTAALARRLFGDRVALWAVFALAVFPLDVFHATQFMPDATLGLLLACSMYAAVKVALDDAGLGWCVAGGLFWGTAYLVKVEAAFLLFPLALLLIGARVAIPKLIVFAGACALVVVGETLVYWGLTGEFLYRLKVVGGTAPILVSEALGGTQLWIFPKAWFVTFYQFSLHYYLLFAGGAWMLVRRPAGYSVMLMWAGAYLIWLQFGLNPFAETLTFKSHLQRYCLMLSAPMAIIIGWTVTELQARRPLLAHAGIVAWFAGSLFLVTFNHLSAEREMASKQLLASWNLPKDVPVYMDSGSYSLGRFLYRDDPWSQRFRRTQRHNFATGETELVALDDIDGFVIYNRGFVAYRAQRYYMAALDPAALDARCERVRRIDNPAGAVSYGAARVLAVLGDMIPIGAIRQKVAGTSTDLLAGADVVLYACDPGEQE